MDADAALALSLSFQTSSQQEHRGAVTTASNNSQPQQQNLLSVTIPTGIRTGQQFLAQGPGGVFAVTCPAGYSSGATLTVLPPS